MDITVRRRKIALSDDVRRAVEEKVARLSRHLEPLDLSRAQIELEELRNPRIADKEQCEIMVVGHGQVVRVRASANEPLVAVDRAVGKLLHRVEKLKGRLDERSHPTHKARNRRAAQPGRSPEGLGKGRVPGASG